MVTLEAANSSGANLTLLLGQLEEDVSSFVAQCSIV